jgi:mannitol/fructose-specific phosphotransferase system IIA component (Ntr-type)
MNVRTEAPDRSEKFTGISSYINPQRIIPQLRAQTKQDVIRALIDKIFETDGRSFEGDITSDHIYRKVIAHENIQTTGLGSVITFPHARVQECTDLVLAHWHKSDRERHRQMVDILTHRRSQL